jgi:hypothetical protein
MKKTIIVLVLVIAGGGAGVWFLVPKTPQKASLTPANGLQQPSFDTQRWSDDEEAKRQQQQIQERQKDLQNEARGFSSFVGGSQ